MVINDEIYFKLTSIGTYSWGYQITTSAIWNSKSTGITALTNSTITSDSNDGYYHYTISNETDLGIFKTYGMIIQTDGSYSIDEVRQKDSTTGTTTYYTINENGVVSLIDTPFTNEIASATVILSEETDTPGYALVACAESSTSDPEAYYFPVSAYSIPVSVTSNVELCTPIDDYFNATAESLPTSASSTTGTFYSVGYEGTSTLYGGTVNFYNGVDSEVPYGYSLKASSSAIAFKVKENLKSHVCVYINGSTNHTIYLKQGTSLDAASTIIGQKQGEGQGTTAVLMCEVTGSTDYFYITGDDGGSDNIYILGVEVIPNVVYPWIWHNKIDFTGDNKMTTTTKNINLDLSSTAISFGATFDDGNQDEPKNATYINCRSDEGTAYQLNSLQYGDNKVMWLGPKDLTSTSQYIMLKYYWFDDFSAGDKIIYYAEKLDGYSQSDIKFYYENNWTEYSGNYTFVENAGTITFEVTADNLATLKEDNPAGGLIIQTSGYRINRIEYEPASSDSNFSSGTLFTVSDNVITAPAPSNFTNELAGITLNLEEGIQAGYLYEKTIAGEKTNYSDPQPVAYYYTQIDFAIPVEVDAEITAELTLSLAGGSRYGHIVDVPYYVYREGKDAIPTPVVKYGETNVTSSSTLAYYDAESSSYLTNSEAKYEWIANLEYTVDSDNNVTDTEADYTPTIKWDSTNSQDVFNLNTSSQLYKNALFKVTVKATYNSYEPKELTYYLVVICPNNTFAKVGSDAKLLVGSENGTTGWDSTDRTIGYDELGVYYVSSAWPILHSWCMTQEMFSSYYSINYEAYTASNKNKSNYHAKATNKDGGSYGNTRLQPQGQSGLTDAMKMTCGDTETRYLEVRVYASGAKLPAEILISKGYYKFIFFDAPTISNADDDGIISTSVSSITINPKNNNGNYTYYTTDSSLPMKLGANNITKYEGTALKKPSHTTVYYAADFVTTDNYFYTGEGGTSNTDNSLAVLSKKYMYVLKPEEAYLVQYDENLIYRDSYGNLVYDDDNNFTKKTSYSGAEFLPDNEELNNRIKAKLKVPASAYTGTEAEKEAAREASLHLMLGTHNVLEYRTVNETPGFYLGGVRWYISPDGGFDEYIDDMENPLFGNNWKPTATSYNDDGTVKSEGEEVWANDSKEEGVGAIYNGEDVNGNPYTECNNGIGGVNTENGGMFLQPVGGDFFRLEPEFDGVATLWVRQNGASENSTRTTGVLTRRPVFIVDEDGYVMRRSSLKPTVESYYCIDGAYAEISGRNTFRRDFEETWRYGLQNWSSLKDDQKRCINYIVNGSIQFHLLKAAMRLTSLPLLMLIAMIRCHQSST